MTDETEDLGEAFEMAHSHINKVEKLLREISGQLGELVSDELGGVETEVTYDRASGAVRVKVPMDDIAERVSKRVGESVVVTASGDELVFRDSKSLISGSGKDSVRDALSIVEEMQSDFDEGAPVDQVLDVLSSTGFTRSKAENKIKNLKQKGELYEPSQGHLRTT